MISLNPTVDGGLDMGIYGDWVSDERHISSVQMQQEEKEDAPEGNVWLKTNRVLTRHRNKSSSKTSVLTMTSCTDAPEIRIVKHDRPCFSRACHPGSGHLHADIVGDRFHLIARPHGHYICRNILNSPAGLLAATVELCYVKVHHCDSRTSRQA
ncbi:hypothetical protein BDR03DRAFT_943981 [Suillus americanus]|nr:hypothetical protein BDR03DRAFT_943981 [Suillus americanus]